MGELVDPPDALLEELRSAGPAESSGSFTLDRERAARLLSTLRFQSPYEYVLKLVQHAVAAGAGQVWVTVLGGSGVSVWYDAAALTERDLADLPRHALEPDRSGPGRHLTHLAEGLQAAEALRPSSVAVEVVTRTEGVRLLRIQEGERLERTWQPREGPWTRIRLRGLDRPLRLPQMPRWAGWLDCLGTRSLGDLYAEFEAVRDSEYSQVWRRCLFAPVPILLNRRVVNRPFFGVPSSVARFRNGALDVVPATFASTPCCVLTARRPSEACIPAPRGLPSEGSLFRESGQPTWLRSATFPSSRWKRMPREEFDRTVVFGAALRSPTLFFEGVRHRSAAFGSLSLWGVDCLAAHAILNRCQERGWLAFVRDGVVIARARPPEDLRGWRIVCRADGLDLDLSGLGVVRNERLDAVLGTLVAAARLALPTDSG